MDDDKKHEFLCYDVKSWQRDALCGIFRLHLFVSFQLVH